MHGNHFPTVACARATVCGGELGSVAQAADGQENPRTDARYGRMALLRRHNRSMKPRAVADVRNLRHQFLGPIVTPATDTDKCIGANIPR
jgi:hypothetical protein